MLSKAIIKKLRQFTNDVCPVTHNSFIKHSLKGRVYPSIARFFLMCWGFKPCYFFLAFGPHKAHCSYKEFMVCRLENCYNVHGCALESMFCVDR